MMRDAIVFYVTFENAAEADAKLFETGAATVTNSNFTIDGSTTVTALTQVVPTRVELELAGFVGGNGPTATTDISMPNVECRVSNASCVGQVDGTTCLSSDGSTAQWQAAPSTARRFVIESRGGNSRCELSGPTAATAVLPSSDALVMGALSITTSSQASVIIRSIVVYGSKP